MNWEFEEISYLYLLLLLPFLVWRILYLYKWKKRTLDQFADSSLQNRIFGNINLSKFIRDNLWVLLVFVLLVFGLVNLLGGIEKKEIKREGIDLVFVVDVSRSMDAEDIPPSRMEKAKKIISEIIKKLGGDRVNTNLISDQGTNIADAILEASNMLSNISNTSKAVVLVSDGEAHKGEVDKAIQMASKGNITIFSIGIGTPQGAPIPLLYENGYSEYKKDENGDVVLTRLQDNSLKLIAAGTKGAYFYGGNSTEEITRQIFNSLSTLNKKEQSTGYTYDAKQYFQIFIGVALFILIIISLTNYKRDFNV